MDFAGLGINDLGAAIYEIVENLVWTVYAGESVEPKPDEDDAVFVVIYHLKI